MKKLFFTFIVTLFCVTVNAQSSFETTNKKSIAKIESAKTADEFNALFNEFSKLTKSASTDKWKAYYYAALVKYKEVETHFPEKNVSYLDENNWLAYKQVTTAEGMQKDDQKIKELLLLINNQQKEIQKLK